MLRSSRTLPGQGWATSTSSASGVSSFGRRPYSAARAGHEVAGQERDVLAPLAQRRHVEGDDVQAEVEVLAEGPPADLLLEVLVGGGDHPHVDGHRGRAAHRLDLLLLEGAQDLGLGLRGSCPRPRRGTGCRRRPARTCPCAAARAPVKAPLVWPKSSLSISSSGMAAQFTSTKGPLARRLWWWMLRATSSLPVPFSPKISTRPLLGAAWAISARSARMAALSPTITKRCSTCCLRRAVLRLQPPLAQGVLDHEQGLLEGERLLDEVLGPMRTAFTAVSMLPWPEITTTGTSGSRVRSRARVSRPSMPGSQTSRRTRS